MKRLLVLFSFAALFAVRAWAVTPVQTVAAKGSGTSLTVTFASAVTAGNTLVMEVYTATAAPTSVTEGTDTVNTRIAWGGGGSTDIAAYDVLGAHGGTTSFVVNVAVSQVITAVAVEYPASSASSYDTASAIATGTSTAPSSAATTPAVSGETAVAVLAANNSSGGSSASSWANGYVFEKGINSNGGTPPSLLLADQTLVGSSPVTAAATLISSMQWSIAQLLYKPAAGGSCTNPGITKAGTFAVPTAGSTVVRLKNGSFGTVDCATGPYKQKSGVFGVN